jgi:hypothetical protein
VSKIVGIGELEDAVAELMEEYGDKATEAIREAAPPVGREARKQLEATSPRGGHRRHYADGWTVRTETTRDGISVIVHNRTKPGLTHLLEYGHALRNGGRSGEFPHIAAVNDAAQKAFVRAVTEKLEEIT